MSTAPGYHRQLLPCSGQSHALSCRLITSHPPAPSPDHEIISQLVTARNNFIQIWNVFEHNNNDNNHAKLHLLYEKRLHGHITHIARVRTLASKKDGADRVLISFKDAKMSLMEWTPSAHELLPISLHTFEKLPQVAEGLALSATDPSSRMSVLLLPSNTGGDGTLAILPFFQEELDLEGLGVDKDAWDKDGLASLPYAPSHLLPLTSLTSSSTHLTPARSSTLFNTSLPSHSASGSAPPVRNISSIVFLPGFTEPTLALLYAPEVTWTGRLENTGGTNFLVSIVTLASSLKDHEKDNNNQSIAQSGLNNTTGADGAGGDPGSVGGSSSPTTAIIISTSPLLPYTSQYIHPCPPEVGGILVVTTNGILHVEQGGKVVGVASNAWFAKDFVGASATSATASSSAAGGAGGALPGLPPGIGIGVGGGSGSMLPSGVGVNSRPGEGEQIQEGLEGSSITFVASTKAVVFLRSGSVLELDLTIVGRSVTSLRLRKKGKGVPGSCVERIRGSKGNFGDRGFVFVGSEVGEGALLKWVVGKEGAQGHTGGSGTTMAMDVDDDDDDEDIYGESTHDNSTITPATPAKNAAVAGPTRSLTLTTCDTVSSYGAIRSFAIGLVDSLADGGDAPAELVACTGGGPTAGLTVFPRSISPRKRRRLDINPSTPEALVEPSQPATRGVWSLRLSTGSNILIASTDSLTKMSFQLPRDYGEEEQRYMSEDVVVEETTIAVGVIESAVDAEVIVRVGKKSVVLLGADLNPIQTHQLSKPAVRASVLPSGYVLVTAAGDGKGTLLKVNQAEIIELSLEGASDEESAGLSVFLDSANSVPLVRPREAGMDVDGGAAASAVDLEEDEEDELYATERKRPHASLASLKDAELFIPPTETSGRSWVSVIDQKGTLKVYALPNMQEVFSSAAVTLLPSIILDGAKQPIPEDVDPDDVEVDRIAIFNIGQSRIRPHLFILLTNGSLAVYEGHSSVSAASSATRPEGSLGLRFVKVCIKRLPPPRRRVAGSPEPAKREFVPFACVDGYSGVFVTGEDPMWVLAADHGQANIYEHSVKGVYSFSEFTFEDEGAGYIVQTREDLSVCSLPANSCFDREMPYIRIPRDRRYAALTFDIDSGLYACGALYDTEFMNFDDEGKPVFVGDSPYITKPTNYRSVLELVAPGTWHAIDGYEFRSNEFISTVKSVTLSTRSTPSGKKDFVCVGTTVHRAEDLAARGGLYLFEVIRILAHPETPHLDHKLRLLSFEDTKSVVGNVCDINGFLVMSMGQKLYIRAFELDETLIAVGFLDVGVHVTSLQSLKNFILIGDALQSVTLVAFQEDPFKLVLLGRDYRPGKTASANFLVNDGKVSFVVGDIFGILRVFEYDPTNITSQAGMKLLCRTEYNTGSEGVTTMLYAKRTGSEDLKQNGILFGGTDGSLYTLIPVRDAVFKRMLALQTHLGRHIQHFGGLNPRGFRMVKNDSVSRAIVKGVLDGDLLAEFDTLPLDLQMRLTELIKSDPDTIGANLRNLSSSF
ncbi:hypothetical protein T439DRAFT_382097 [Meredithblackwellia eburnea MCA 4105]